MSSMNDVQGLIAEARDLTVNTITATPAYTQALVNRLTDALAALVK